MKRLFTALVTASLLAGCGSSSPTAVPSTPSRVALTVQAVIFSFSDDVALLTKPGTRAQVTAIGIFTDGAMQNVTASCTNWQSDNTSVLTIDGHGLITAQSDRGSATISTNYQGVSARDIVTVNAASVAPTPGPRFRIGAICTDGWVSGAIGSGACSSHGGVSCWRYNDGTCTNP